MEWIPPMEPIATGTLLTGPEWVHQIKWDGIRGMTYYQSGSASVGLHIFTKNGRDRTQFYPELHGIQAGIRAGNAVLDGEMVVLGQNGRPSFHFSLMREQVRNPDRLAQYTRAYPVAYVLFDILFRNDRLLTGLPWKERAEILRDTISFPAGSNIAITDDFSDGQALFQLMKKKNWEGIVSKRRDSLYLPAKKHHDWYKHKALKRILSAVCGIQWKGDFPSSLVLGIHPQDQWICIGKASLGLTQKDLDSLKEFSQAQRKESCPFPDVVRSSVEGSSGPIVWLNPQITCWVCFLEWTDKGYLRHPRILGFTDLRAEEANGREWSMDD